LIEHLTRICLQRSSVWAQEDKDAAAKFLGQALQNPRLNTIYARLLSIYLTVEDNEKE
jgi:hypothetical protein